MSKRLNLLPKDAATNRLAIGTMPAGLRIHPVWVVGLIAVAWLASNAPRFSHQMVELATQQQVLEQLRQEEAKLQSKVRAAEEQLASDRSALKLLQAETETKSKGLAKAQGSATPLSSVTTDLAALIPDQVWLTKLGYSAHSLTLTGASDDAGAATRLMESLEKSGKFLETTFGYARRSTVDKESSANKSHAFVFEISTVPVLGLEVKEGRS